MDVENALRAIGNGLDHTVGLSGLNFWLQKLERAIGAEGKLAAAEREWQLVRDAAASSCERLAETLRSAGVELSAERRPGGDAVRGTSRSGSRGGRQEPTSDPRGSKAGPERSARRSSSPRGSRTDHGARLGKGLARRAGWASAAEHPRRRSCGKRWRPFPNWDRRWKGKRNLPIASRRCSETKPSSRRRWKRSLQRSAFPEVARTYWRSAKKS